MTGNHDTSLHGSGLRPKHAWRWAGAAAAVLLCLGGSAAAAGGLSVGSARPGNDPPIAPDYRQADETVVALGEDPQIGAWHIATYRSRQLVDRGEVVQPGGLPCLKLALHGLSGSNPIASRSYCGDRGTGGLAAATLPVRLPSGQLLTVIFGPAPEDAARVAVVNSDGGEHVGRLLEGTGGAAGDFWIAVTRGGSAEARTWVEVTTSDASRSGARFDLSPELRRPMSPIPLPAG